MIIFIIGVLLISVGVSLFAYAIVRSERKEGNRP